MDLENVVVTGRVTCLTGYGLPFQCETLSATLPTDIAFLLRNNTKKQHFCMGFHRAFLIFSTLWKHFLTSFFLCLWQILTLVVH